MVVLLVWLVWFCPLGRISAGRGSGGAANVRSRRAMSGVIGSSSSSIWNVTASSPSPGRTSVMRAPRGSGGNGR